MFVKNFRIILFIISLETAYLLIQAISGLTGVGNKSGLLLALTIFDESAPRAKKSMLDGLLLHFSEILKKEKGEANLKLSIPYFDD